MIVNRETVNILVVHATERCPNWCALSVLRRSRALVEGLCHSVLMVSDILV